MYRIVFKDGSTMDCDEAYPFEGWLIATNYDDVGGMRDKVILSPEEIRMAVRVDA